MRGGEETDLIERLDMCRGDGQLSLCMCVCLFNLV